MRQLWPDIRKVKEAATFLFEEDQQLVQIGAAVILDSGSEITQKELLTHCRGHLPAYAVPHRIEIMTEFPRTSSGKIRRSELIKHID